MTIRYVGIGGNDANDGLSWANRKLTLNGAEDTPVAAGDIVYVGAGRYKEMLTCDVAGSSGSPITYIGDYTGKYTDGVGGEVILTMNNDDDSYTANHLILASKDFRTFEGFTFDTPPELTGFYKFGIVSINASNLIVRSCVFYWGFGGIDILYTDTTPRTHLIENCVFIAGYYGVRIRATGGNVDNDLTTIQNCLFFGYRYNGAAIIYDYVGGTSVNNCSFMFIHTCISMSGHALTAGQHVTVKNCMFSFSNSALVGVASYTADITEDYNNFCFCNTLRSNVDTGVNSTTKYHIINTRWAHDMFNGKKSITPFDHSPYSRLVNVAGSSPTSTDIRGTGTIGAQRELGAIEYDPSVTLGNILATPGMTGGING